MKTLTVFGASDDLIEFSGIEGCDEFYANEGKLCVGVFHVETQADPASLSIYAIYDGCWCFAVGALDGDDFNKFPDWPIRRSWGEKDGSGSVFSEMLEIDVPDDAVLRREK